jgi:hypothetical protein
MIEEERWTQVVIKHHGEAFEKGIYKKYEVSDKCRIRNFKTKKLLSDNNERVGLYGCGIYKLLRRHRICFGSIHHVCKKKRNTTIVHN